MIVFLCILLNQKMIYFCNWYYSIIWFIFHTIGSVILADVGAATFFAYLPIIGGMLQEYRNRAYYADNFRFIVSMFLFLLALGVALTLHILFIKYSFFTDDHPYLWYLVKIVGYELILALIVGSMALGFFAVTYAIRWSRDKYQLITSYFRRQQPNR